jgi:Asp/Glu/hydantoin racemase
MPYTVALVHTRLRSVDLLNREFSLHLPHVYKFNILDDTIYFEMAQNGLTPRLLNRLIQHFTWAELMRANIVLNTTTVLDPAVPICQKFVSIPILRFNEPMCEQAITEGRRICVLGSVEQAIGAVADLLREVAGRQDREVEVISKHVPEAHEQLDMGNWDMHNRLMVEAVRGLAGQCDVIVIAQIPLLPLIPVLKREIDVPILGSAEPMIARLTKIVSSRVPTPLPHLPRSAPGAQETVV